MATADLFQRQEKFTARIRASRQAVLKEARWKIRGDQYLRAYGGMDPEAMVRVDPAVQAAAARVIEGVAPVVAAAFERHLVPVAEAAFDAWPVDTGLSKSLLFLRFDQVLGGTAFRGTIGNTAPYGRFIRYGKARNVKGQFRSATVEQALINEPGRRAADEMRRDIGTAASEIVVSR